jgi:hypothetical protein
MAHELMLPGRLAGLNESAALLDTELPPAFKNIHRFSSWSPVDSVWKS